MGLLSLEEAREAGSDAELPAVACKHSAAETVHGQRRHLGVSLGLRGPCWGDAAVQGVGWAVVPLSQKHGKETPSSGAGWGGGHSRAPEEPLEVGLVRALLLAQEGADVEPLGSVTSGPRRRSAKLCTVSSGSLPRAVVNSLSPAQNRGLEKGGDGRSSPLWGGGG